MANVAAPAVHAFGSATLEDDVRSVFIAALNYADFWRQVKEGNAEPGSFNPVTQAGLQAAVFGPLDSILAHRTSFPSDVLEEVSGLARIHRRIRSVFSLPDAYLVLSESAPEFARIGHRGLLAIQRAKAVLLHPAVPLQPSDTQLPPGLEPIHSNRAEGGGFSNMEPAFLYDPLYRELTGCIIRLEQNSWQTVFEKAEDSIEGMNMARSIV